MQQYANMHLMCHISFCRRQHPFYKEGKFAGMLSGCWYYQEVRANILIEISKSKVKKEVAFSKCVPINRRVKRGSEAWKVSRTGDNDWKIKKTIFPYLKERTWKKLQGWKEKLMAFAGKNILVKAVAQAIPSYMMIIFMTPNTLIIEIHLLLNHFWWSLDLSVQKFHCNNWEKLCLPKVMGDWYLEISTVLAVV